MARVDDTAQSATVLVLDASPMNDWYKLFRRCRLADGRSVRVEQTEWRLLKVPRCDVGEDFHVEINPSEEPIPGSSQRTTRERVVDGGVVVRQFVRGLHDENWLPTLSAMQTAALPAVNTLQSIFLNTDRAVVIGELVKISRRLGKERFPLVPMLLFPGGSSALATDGAHALQQRRFLPAVAKVGTSLGGWGKMRLQTAEDVADFGSVTALSTEMVTVEPFVVGKVADIRVQCIGSNVRAYRRIARNWKGNVGESVVEDIEMTDDYKMWAIEGAKAFGGMDVFSIDAVVDDKGRHTILEMNDCCTGFMPIHFDEDMLFLRDLVLQRLSAQSH